MVSFFDHQVGAVRKLLPVLQQTGGAYVAHDVGTGKTLTALIMTRLLKVNRVLVLTPVVGIGVWLREINKWWPTAPAAAFRGGTHLPLAEGFVVTNYDQLSNGKGEVRLRALFSWAPELLILDEAHYCKNPTAKRTRAIFRLAKGTHYRLLLSGTQAHTPLDWWAQYRIVAPQDPVWAQKFRTYREKLAIMGGPQQNWVVGFRPSEKEAALRAMAPYTHVASSAELKLPAPVETIVPVQLGGEEQRVYAAMEKHFVAELTDGGETDAATVLVKALRLHQIASGVTTDTDGQTRIVGSAKLRACLDLIEERAHQKVVVACRFREELRRLAEALRKMKRPYMVIDGSVSPETRTDHENRFQREDKPYVMLLQNRAGGVAITLTAAKALILSSLDPSVITFQQVVGRVWRAGQTGHVQILPLIAENTIDAKLYAGLQQGLDSVALARLLAEDAAWRVAA